MKNFKEEMGKPTKVAFYVDSKFGFTHVAAVRYETHDKHWNPLPEGELREVPLSGSVRISEPVEVTFRPIDDKAIVRNAVEAIDEEERKLYAELNRKLADLKERKNQLLALTYQPE
jgi:hypothetical protein